MWFLSYLLYGDSKHPYKLRGTSVAHLFLLGPAAGGLCQGIRRRALRTGLGKGDGMH